MAHSPRVWRPIATNEKDVVDQNVEVLQCTRHLLLRNHSLAAFRPLGKRLTLPHIVAALEAPSNIGIFIPPRVGAVFHPGCLENKSDGSVEFIGVFKRSSKIANCPKKFRA